MKVVQLVMLVTILFQSMCLTSWSGGWNFDQGVDPNVLKAIQQNTATFVKEPVGTNKGSCNEEGLADLVKKQLNLKEALIQFKSSDETANKTAKDNYMTAVKALTLTDAENVCLSQASDLLAKEVADKKEGAVSDTALNILKKVFNLR